MARPIKYGSEVYQRIFDRLKNGELLTDICKEDGYPNWSTFHSAIERDKALSDAYTHARLQQQHHWADEIVKISKDTSRDIIYAEVYDKAGNLVGRKPQSDNTAVNRDRLIIDTKKWVMARVAASVFGDKVQQEISGKDGASIQPVFNITVEAKRG